MSIQATGSWTVRVRIMIDLEDYRLVLGTRLTEPVVKAAATTLAATANIPPSLTNYVSASNVELTANYMASILAAGAFGLLDSERMRKCYVYREMNVDDKTCRASDAYAHSGSLGSQRLNGGGSLSASAKRARCQDLTHF
jgi:hypothetical protein